LPFLQARISSFERNLDTALVVINTFLVPPETIGHIDGVAGNEMGLMNIQSF